MNLSPLFQAQKPKTKKDQIILLKETARVQICLLLLVIIREIFLLAREWSNLIT